MGGGGGRMVQFPHKRRKEEGPVAGVSITCTTRGTGSGVTESAQAKKHGRVLENAAPLPTPHGDRAAAEGHDPKGNRGTRMGPHLTGRRPQSYPAGEEPNAPFWRIRRRHVKAGGANPGTRQPQLCMHVTWGEGGGNLPRRPCSPGRSRTRGSGTCTNPAACLGSPHPRRQSSKARWGTDK